MSYWNYRVVVDLESSEPLPTMSEVYYNNDDSPYAYSDAALCGEDSDELTKQLDRFRVALKKEWLYYPDDFVKFEKEEEYKSFRETVGRINTDDL